MKVRNDFVTNSSSSSFVLAFESDEKFNEFYNECNEYNYLDFYELVKDWKQEVTQEEKEEIANNLQRFYEYEFCDKRGIIDEVIHRENYQNYIDYSRACDAYSETEEYKEKIRNLLNNTDYYKKRKKIFKAKYILSGTIYDYDGGTLEWAIRNGFVERNFPRECIYCWNIG